MTLLRIAFFLLLATARAQSVVRTDCQDARCRRIEALLRARYCGESPYGNGPERGCDLRSTPGSGESPRLPAASRAKLLNELKELGVAGPNWHTAFRASDARAAWRVLEATAGLKDGDDVSVSQVVAVLGPNSQFTILHRTKASLSDDATVWTALDIADADGDGQVDIILRGDAYEDHWLEVFRLENGVWKIAYAGLGYWL